jgi:uncharacterized protein (TIGR03382 family)
VFGDPPRVDNNGDPVPSCSSSMANPAITEPTMFNFQDCGETKKETLEPDDIDAICSIYPLAKDPGTCAPVSSGGGCCSTGTGLAGPAVLLGVTLVALRRRRR